MAKNTDQTADAKSATKAARPGGSWLWLLTFVLAVAFIGSGLVGHAPWKAEEVQTLAAVESMAASGDLLMPVDAGEPARTMPPLYAATATLLGQQLADVVSQPDAARVTSGLFLAVTFMVAALLGRLTWKPAETKGVGAVGSMVVLILMGTLGILWFGHDVVADSALVAGMTMGLYGLLLVPRQSLLGGLWLGTGMGVAFLAKGLLGPGILAATAVLMPFFATWGGLGRQLRGFFFGLLFALPWLLIWPWMLYQRDAQLFDAWLWGSNLSLYFDNIALGTPAENLQWLWTFLVMAFPAWLLAALALILRPGALFGLPGVRLALLASLVGWAALLTAEAAEPVHALALLVPLAVIGAGALTRLPGLLVLPIKWLSGLLFTAVAVAGWGVWLYLKYQGQVPEIAALAALLPDGAAFSFQAGVYLVAAGATVLWLWILMRYRAPRPAALLVWPAGVLMTWTLVMLHQPLVDQVIGQQGRITGLSFQAPYVLTESQPSATPAAASSSEAPAARSSVAPSAD